MASPQRLYGHTATHFTLRFFLRSETEAPGGLVVELANIFLADLVFPRSHLFSPEGAVWTNYLRTVRVGMVMP